MTVLLELHQQGLISMPDSVVGVVGVGRIGSALSETCKKLGMRLLLNDPPRERSEGAEGFSSMQRVLAEADVVTLHTPLICDGDDRTFHLIDSEWLSRFQGRGIINAARGGCIDNEALLNWLNGDQDRFAVLDCWEGEPDILEALLAHPGLVIATPHIAGHSLDGKAANTQYVYHALCSHLGVEPLWNMKDALPAVEAVGCDDVEDDLWRSLHTLSTALYPIMRDSQGMKGWLELADVGLGNCFVGFRRNYPVRRAWGCQQVSVMNPSEIVIEYAQNIGINVIS